MRLPDISSNIIKGARQEPRYVWDILQQSGRGSGLLHLPLEPRLRAGHLLHKHLCHNLLALAAR